MKKISVEVTAKELEGLDALIHTEVPRKKQLEVYKACSGFWKKLKKEWDR